MLVGKTPPHSGICGNCSVTFYARIKGKKFCSMKCYVTSPQFTTMRSENASKGGKLSAVRSGRSRKKRPCVGCGELVFLRPKCKYCSRSCFRRFMTERFDRWIANPTSIALPQCFDEFLIQDNLPCLIDGCEWVGEHLGSHVNLAHGILAKEFKKEAGFNIGTGLVTLDVSESMSRHSRSLVASGQIKTTPATLVHSNSPREYKSLEGREHWMKSMTLSRLNRPMKVKFCPNCDRTFSTAEPTKVYCSVDCRTIYYKAKLKER